MKVVNYTPRLTPEEAERCWMTPTEVCRLAQVGEVSDPKVKKLLNTISDRGLVPFVKSGPPPAPRLYPLVSAAMLRVIFEITRDGRTYQYAQAVAEETRTSMLRAIRDIPSVSELDLQMSEKRLYFGGIRDGGPAYIRWDNPLQFDMTYSVYDAGYLIFRILDSYADFWHADLVKRGVLTPEPDPHGFDENARPIWGYE